MPDETPEGQYHPESTHRQSPVEGSLSRWLAPIALLVAVVAVGLAVWALTTGSPGNAPATAQQSGDPKMRACTAFDTVSKAVSGQTNNDLGPDPIAQAAVAGNARLALLGGGQYLLNRLDPSTSPDLADPVRSFANDLEDIGMNALANVPNSDPGQAALLTKANDTRMQIVDMCK